MTDPRPFHGSCDPWVELDLGNLRWNVGQIRKHVGRLPVMAVVKSNAYGHGLLEIGKALEETGVEALAVGQIREAAALRGAGVGIPILNLGPFGADDAEFAVRKNISLAAYHDNVQVLDEAARRAGTSARVHVNIDTGLGRVGVPYREASDYLRSAASRSHVKIDGVFTALSEDRDHDEVQLERLREACDGAGKAGISVGLRHAASSAGVCSLPESHLDMVRPGILLYGHYPNDEEERIRRLDLKPVLSLKARVSFVKTLRKGDHISYHRAYTAEGEERVATASIGSSDGFPPRVVGKGAHALIRGRKFPLIAAVTANHVSIRVEENAGVRTGDEVVLIGRQESEEIRAEDLARSAGVSVYKIVTSISPLLRRSCRTS